MNLRKLTNEELLQEFDSAQVYGDATMKKYELTEETIMTNDNRKLYRIRALKDFSNVKAGDLGGFVESENNLSQEGNCWIYDDAKVYGDAWVFENARISDYARVFDSARVYGSAKVFDNARISDYAQVYGSAWVFGNAQVFGSLGISGSERVSGKEAIN